jgi:outer membrane lipoprotein SlyB
MRLRIISLLICFVPILTFGSCSTVMEEHKGAAVGTGAGAATGAIAGAVIGKGTGAVVLGALIGGLVGGAVGHYAYDKPKSREETAKTYNYKPSQGTILTIEGASVSPQTVSPGNTVNLNSTYAVLTPSSETEVSITETREITHKGELVGKPEVRVNRTGGTYTSTIPIRLPADAATGDYKVITTVQSANAKDSKETHFTVK